MALRIYKFEFKGLALGGDAVIIASTFEEAKAVVKTLQPYNDEPTCEDEKGDVIKAGIVSFNNGDY